MSNVVALLRELVAIGSVNPMGRGLEGPNIGEARLTDYLERFFKGLGVPTERQAIAPGRENVVAAVAMPNSAQTVLFEVHQDTVPVDNMTIDPFAAEVRDGRVWGRGACDVKGGMAAMLVAVERLVRERPPSAASVVMACTVDEEHQFGGVRRLLDDPPKVTMAVTAEPTNLDVIIAHKGVVRWKVRSLGKSCHSANPERGENAVYRMAPILEAIERYAAELADGPRHRLVGPATLSVGVIRGGTSVNTVPNSCEIEVDRRVLPGEDPQEAYEDAKRYLQERAEIDVPFEIDDPWIVDPALDTPEGESVVQTAATAVERVLGRVSIAGVSYGTDGSKIARAGIPVIVLGPGDIAQAHTEAEYIAIDQLEQAAEIYYQMLLLAG